MKRMTITAALLGGLAVAMVGCAKPPTEAVKAADDKLAEARTAEASEYAPQQMAAAEDARRKLDAELKAQEEKFAMMRSYDAAEKLVAEVQTASANAATAARAEKEKQRQEATQMLAAARETLATVTGMLETAPRTKGTKADLEALAADLTAVDQALTSAGEALAEERFSEVRAKVSSASQTMDSVRTSIETANAMRGSRPGRT